MNKEKKKMMKFFESEGFDEKGIEDMCCPNGSFTCGLLTKLKMGSRCKSCGIDKVLKRTKGK